MLLAEIFRLCASQGNDTLLVSDHLEDWYLNDSKFNSDLNEALLPLDMYGLEAQFH
jgi:hypothetical protein